MNTNQALNNNENNTTTFESVLTIFTEIYRELNSEKRDDGLGNMPVYYEDESQEYQEHYIDLGHDQYCANLSFSFDDDTNTMSVCFTSDDEDRGTDSLKTLSEAEEAIVRKKRDLLIEMFRAKLTERNIDIEWELSHSSE